MKKVWIFFLGLMMLAAITVGAVACNKGEEETGTRVVLYDFEQSILPVGMFQDFGALDINEDAQYVHGGVRSLELRPASDGETDALMYFPFESSVLGFDYKNGDRISEVRFWCYAPKQMTVQAGLYFTADAGKRGVSSEIALEQGWNEAVYTLDHAALALVNDLSATYGLYLEFTADTVPAAENVKLYVDDLSILVQDEDIEYEVVIPELTKQTGDVIAFNTINFGVVEQKSTGTSDWFSEFEGRDGVVALEADSDWPYYRNRTFWTAAYDKAYYEDYDFLVFRAYATGVLNAYYQIQGASSAIEYILGFTEENSGRWVDFVLPIDTFLDNFDSFKTLGQFMAYAPSDETVYIDSIRAVNIIEESYAPEKASATEGETVSLVAAGLAEAYPDTEFTYIVNGVTVADPSAFVLGEAGTYTVVYEGVVDGKLMRGDYVFTSLIRGEELTFDNKIAEPGAKISLVPDELDKDYGDISFTFTVNGNRVVDPSAYTVENEKGRYTVYFEGADATGYLYYGSYILSVGDYGDNFADVYTYDTAASAPTGGDVNNASWLASYEGAEGVLKMDVGSWDWLGYMNTDAWQPYFGKDTYKKYEYLAFRVRLEGLNAGETLNAYFKVEGATAEDNAEYGLSLTANTDGWTTVLMPIDILVNNLDGFAQKTQWTFYIANRNGTSNAVLYIDSLTAVNVVEGKSVAASPGEELNLVTLSGITSAEDVEFTVNGAAVSDPAKYTVSARGRYTVMYISADNTQIGTFELQVGKKDNAGADVMMFDSAASAPGCYDLGEGEWLASFEGASGVIKLEANNGGWPWYQNIEYWAPVFDADVYAKYDYLEFRVYASGTLDLYYQDQNTHEYALHFGGGNLDTDQWVTYRVSIETFLNNYDSFLQSGRFMAFAEGVAPDADSTYVYIDSIRAVNYSEITVDDMVVVVGGQVDFTSIEAFAEATELTVQIDGETLQGTSFTPTAAGEYTVVITGETGTQYIRAEFTLRAAEKGMVLDFSSAGDAPTGGDVTEATYLNNYEGATGVLKMHVGIWKGYTNASGWKPIFDSSAYSGYTHLAFRIKVEGFTGTNFKFYYKVEGTGGDSAVEYVIEFTANTNGWTTVYLPIETFVKNLDGFAQKTQFTFINTPESNETQTYLYLDSIRAVSKISVEDMAVKIGESVDFKDIAEFSGATGLTVEIGGVLQSGTTFAPNAAGEYTVLLTGEIGGKYSCAEFILRAAEEGMVLDFSANGDRPTGNDASGLCELLSEFEGADGVLKLEASTNWPAYSYNGAFKPIFDKAVYQGYEYLEFRVYATGVLNLYFQVGGASPAVEYMLQFGNGNLDTNQWVTYRVSIETFLNNYDSFLQSGRFMAFAEGVAPDADSTYVYIDSIRAVDTTE